MTIDNIFTENRDIINSPAYNAFSKEGFRKLVEERGIDAAQGYLMALKDIDSKLVSILNREIRGGAFKQDSPHNIKKKSDAFHTDLNNFLNDTDIQNFANLSVPLPALKQS
jgi:hypothetical protein